jgi:RNA polymerase sigma-70 factor (ECF subfamily)
MDVPPRLSARAGEGGVSGSEVSAAYEQFCAAAQDCERDLHRRALQLTHNTAEAFDLTQRALERGLRRLHQFTPGTNIRPWLLRILCNLFIDDCRRSSHGPRLVPLDELPTAGLATEEEDEEPAWAKITPEQFQSALMSLPPLFRQVYELRVRDGLSYHEISRRLAIPANTVGTRLARARRHLHQSLAPVADGCGDLLREGRT